MTWRAGNLPALIDAAAPAVAAWVPRPAIAAAVAAALAISPAHAALDERRDELVGLAQVLKARHDDPRPLWELAGFLGAMRFLRPAPEVISLTISADTNAQYNIFTAAGSPTKPVTVVVTIASGVKVRNQLAATMVTGSGWVTGSTIRILNLGYILGDGGQGGDGGNATGTATGSNGGPGYDAIQLSWPITIDNTNGYIFGGGGGGGGGGAYSSGLPAAGGGGGGGGQAAVASSGGAVGGPSPGTAGGLGAFAGRGLGGGAGTDSFYGVSGGDGGHGGTWGSTGNSGNASGTHGGGTGGAPGQAVALGGHGISW